jgi:hypothetical protein
VTATRYGGRAFTVSAVTDHSRQCGKPGHWAKGVYKSLFFVPADIYVCLSQNAPQMDPASLNVPKVMRQTAQMFPLLELVSNVEKKVIGAMVRASATMLFGYDEGWYCITLACPNPEGKSSYDPKPKSSRSEGGSNRRAKPRSTSSTRRGRGNKSGTTKSKFSAADE